jgi:hypothetical protein
MRALCDIAVLGSHHIIDRAPRLKFLARPVAATNLEGLGWPRAVSDQGAINSKNQIKNLYPRRNGLTSIIITFT